MRRDEKVSGEEGDGTRRDERLGKCDQREAKRYAGTVRDDTNTGVPERSEPRQGTARRGEPRRLGDGTENKWFAAPNKKCCLRP